jgi:hypothetical protein
LRSNEIIREGRYTYSERDVERQSERKIGGRGRKLEQKILEYSCIIVAVIKLYIYKKKKRKKRSQVDERKTDNNKFKE